MDDKVNDENGFDGQVVQLKSGGPNMVVLKVERVGPDEKRLIASCAWFDGHGKINYEKIPCKALRLAT